MEKEQEKGIIEGLSNSVNYNRIVKQILEKFPIYYDKSKIWYIYNSKEFMWEITDEIDILNLINKSISISNISKPFIRSQILNALQMEARKIKPKEIDKYEVQFKDKIINVITGEERIATKEDFSLNPIDYELGETEDTPIMDKFMESWVGKDNVKLLQEIMAYCILPSYPIHRCFILNGSGSNGKSTYNKLIENFGKKNIGCGDFETIFLERFGTSYLYGKTAVVMGECNFHTLSKTGKFKSATGGDSILIEYKGKKAFEYINYGKIIINTNSIPVTLDKTDGFYRRITIVDFPNKFKEKINVLNLIPKEEYNNFAKKSIRLLKEILEKGKFTNEGSIEEKRDIYEKISNPLNTFINEFLIEDPNSHVSRKEFKNRLNKWLRANGKRVYTARELNNIMYQDYETNHRNVKGKYERCWLGLSWKEDIEHEVEIIKINTNRGERRFE